MTINHVVGGGQCGIAVNANICPGEFENQGLTMGNPYPMTTAQIVRLKLKGGCSRVKFSVVWLDTSLKVGFYKKGDVLLEEKILLGGSRGGVINHKVDFTAQGNEEITAIQLQTLEPDWLGFDFFEFFGWCPLE